VLGTEFKAYWLTQNDFYEAGNADYHDLTIGSNTVLGSKSITSPYLK